jgi:hypothetical protein
MRWGGAAGWTGHSSKELVRGTILPESAAFHAAAPCRDQAGQCRACQALLHSDSVISSEFFGAIYLFFQARLPCPPALRRRTPATCVSALSVARHFALFDHSCRAKTHQTCAHPCRKGPRHAAFSPDKKTFDCQASRCYRVGAFGGMRSRGKT